MSDETPRDLSEQEIQTIERGMTLMAGTATLVSARELQSLCHMASRGARAAELLTADVLKKSRTAQREAFQAQLVRAPTDVPKAREAGDDAMRRVLLNALTGAGEETT